MRVEGDVSMYFMYARVSFLVENVFKFDIYFKQSCFLFACESRWMIEKEKRVIEQKEK